MLKLKNGPTCELCQERSGRTTFKIAARNGLLLCPICDLNMEPPPPPQLQPARPAKSR